MKKQVRKVSLLSRKMNSASSFECCCGYLNQLAWRYEYSNACAGGHSTSSPLSHHTPNGEVV